jgi:2-methylcitrate dehydratase PrpD
MTKPFHAGHAASAGVLAAILAKRGMTAEPKTVEAEAGFCRTFVGDKGFDLGKMTNSLSDPWDLIDPGVHVKRHACNAGAHPAIDAMLILRAMHRIVPQEVREIRIGLTPMTKKELIHNDPGTPLEAKFSIQYCVAMALLEGKVGIDQFTAEQLSRSDVKELIGKTKADIHPDLSASGYHEDPKAIVEVFLKNGRKLAQRVDVPKGHAGNPLTKAEMEEKFIECAGRKWSKERIKNLLREIFKLEQLTSLDELARKLGA